MIPVEMALFRECPKCNQFFNLIGFVKRQDRPYNRGYECRKCGAKRAATYIFNRKKNDPQWHELRKAKNREAYRIKCETDPDFVAKEKARKSDPEYRRKRNEAERHKRATDAEYREKINASRRTQEYREKERERKRTPEFRKARKEKLRKKRIENPEWHKKLLDKNKTPEARKKTNDRFKERYANDESFRKKKLMESFLQRNRYQEPYELDDFCAYCGSAERLSADHMIPISYNIKHGISEKTIGNYKNITTACLSCNSIKSDRMPDIPDMINIMSDLLGYNPKLFFSEKCFWKQGD